MDLNDIIRVLADNWPGQRTPTAVRTLADTLFGVKDPITENNLSPDELDFLKKLIQNKESYGPSQFGQSIQYGDYQDYAKRRALEGNRVVSTSPGLSSVFDSFGNMQTTLGRFNYKYDDDGGLTVLDHYDFNQLPSAFQNSALNTGLAFGPFGVIRQHAGIKIPADGKSGRDVRIKLK